MVDVKLFHCAMHFLMVRFTFIIGVNCMCIYAVYTSDVAYTLKVCLLSTQSLLQAP